MIYIGPFPGERGGVTVKNELLYNELKKTDKKIIKVNSTYLFNSIYNFIHGIIYILLPIKRVYIIGLSLKNRNRFTKYLYYFKRESMKNSILIIMGGNFSSDIINTSKEKEYKVYKKIFVETQGNYNDLKERGFNNLILFPNPKNVDQSLLKIIDKEIQNKNFSNQKLNLVFFSKISKMKGIDVIFESLELIPEEIGFQLNIDFYGDIDANDKRYFFSNLKKYKNVKYCGIFSGSVEDIILRLNDYDVLLFPSKWLTEGIPGVFVEAKFAGIPIISFDVSNNKDLINNYHNGILVNEISSLKFSSAITKLYKDRELLKKISLGSFSDSKNFVLDDYLKYIEKGIENEE